MSTPKHVVYKRRLLKLADFLEKLPKEKFDYGVWAEDQTHSGKCDSRMTACGTAGCALGWACTIPSFRRLGVRLDVSTTGNCAYPVTVNGRGKPDYGATEVAQLLFGLNPNEANYLFYEGTSSNYYLHSPKNVAKKIRKFAEKKNWKEDIHG